MRSPVRRILRFPEPSNADDTRELAVTVTGVTQQAGAQASTYPRHGPRPGACTGTAQRLASGGSAGERGARARHPRGGGAALAEQRGAGRTPGCGARSSSRRRTAHTGCARSAEENRHHRASPHSVQRTAFSRMERMASNDWKPYPGGSTRQTQLVRAARPLRAKFWREQTSARGGTRTHNAHGQPF